MTNSTNKLADRSEIRGVIVVVLSAMAFGLYPSTAKLAYAEGANSSFVIVSTTLIRAFFLIAICLSQGKALLPRKAEIRTVVTVGFFQAASIFGIIASLVYLPAPVTITIVFTHTTMLFLLLVIRKEEKMNYITLLTTVSALVGVSFVVNLFANENILSSLGIALAFVGAIATTIRLYMFGKQLALGNPAVVGAQVFSASFLFTVLIFLFQSPVLPDSFSGFLWVLISGLALAIPTYGMFIGISLIGPFQFSLLMKIEPIFTAIFAVLILGEILNRTQYFGMVLVITSLIVSQLNSSRLKRLEV